MNVWLLFFYVCTTAAVYKIPMPDWESCMGAVSDISAYITPSGINVECRDSEALAIMELECPYGIYGVDETGKGFTWGALMGAYPCYPQCHLYDYPVSTGWDHYRGARVQFGDPGMGFGGLRDGGRLVARLLSNSRVSR